MSFRNTAAWKSRPGGMEDGFPWTWLHARSLGSSPPLDRVPMLDMNTDRCPLIYKYMAMVENNGKPITYNPESLQRAKARRV